MSTSTLIPAKTLSTLSPALLHRMDALATSNPVAFNNLSDTINAMYYMNYATTMERALLSRDTSSYRCFDLEEANEAEFNSAYGLYANAKTYIWISQGEDPHAAIYCIDYSGYIRYRKHFYDKADIEAMLYRFHDSLRLCVPLWHVEQYLASFQKQITAGGLS